MACILPWRNEQQKRSCASDKCEPGVKDVKLRRTCIRKLQRVSQQHIKQREP